jgi:virginiamycin B lyase
MWFGEQSGTVGKISPSGQITEFELPARDAFDHDITSGPHGNLWSTDFLRNRIRKIRHRELCTSSPWHCRSPRRA